jgi:hypothetical protein
MDMAGLEAELHIIERLHAGKGFAYMLDFQKIFGRSFIACNGAALAASLRCHRTSLRHGRDDAAPSQPWRSLRRAQMKPYR